MPRNTQITAALRRSRRTRALTILAAVASAVLLAACGSSGKSSAKQSSSSSSGSSGSASASTSSGGSGSSGSTVVVGKVSGYGSVLETSAGEPVYVLSTDPSGSSKCNGSCATTWKPLTVSGAASGGSGVSSSMLSTFKRGDGSTQVLYNKHALYTHAGSAATVAGTASDGGVWYLINAKGAPVKSTTAGGY